MNTPQSSDEPYALAAVRTEEDPPRIHLECNPRPDGAQTWPPALRLGLNLAESLGIQSDTT